MVDGFIKVYPRNKYIVLSDQDQVATVKAGIPENIETEHTDLFIHPMKRAGIRELTRRWLEPAGLHSNKNVEAVLSKLDSFNLPKTAHVVSMVLWTVEKEDTLGQLNEASLLQRFVEANLNRSNPTDLGSGPIKRFLLR